MDQRIIGSYCPECRIFCIDSRPENTDECGHGAPPRYWAEVVPLDGSFYLTQDIK